MSYESIPQPPVHLYGALGNLPDIDPSFPTRSYWQLHALYGPIVQLNLLNRKMILVSNYEIAKEVMNDENYEKQITGGLEELRPLIKDGLFTAYPHELVSPSAPIFLHETLARDLTGHIVTTYPDSCNRTGTLHIAL